MMALWFSEKTYTHSPETEIKQSNKILKFIHNIFAHNSFRLIVVDV